MAKPLWQQLYFDEVYTEARIIGYAGITPFGFQDAAKALADKHGQQKGMNAAHDLTRTDRREASPPRYELNGPACCSRPRAFTPARRGSASGSPAGRGL